MGLEKITNPVNSIENKVHGMTNKIGDKTRTMSGFTGTTKSIEKRIFNNRVGFTAETTANNLAKTIEDVSNVKGHIDGVKDKIGKNVKNVKNGIKNLKKAIATAKGNIESLFGKNKKKKDKKRKKSTLTTDGIGKNSIYDIKLKSDLTTDGIGKNSISEEYSEFDTDINREEIIESNLRKFYEKFRYSQKDVDVVDPYSTFECDFEFFPNEEEQSKIYLQLIKEVYSTKDDQKDKIDFDFYIQKAALPNIDMETTQSNTLVGTFPIPGQILKPTSNKFSMEIVNVKHPVIENVLYPWMHEARLPKWQYKEQPFTTARITFDFGEHSSVKYVFHGCWPTQINMIQPDQSPTQNVTRNIEFAFKFMTIEKTEWKQDEEILSDEDIDNSLI